MKRFAAWLETPSVQNALIVLILANAAILGLETFPAVAIALLPATGALAVLRSLRVLRIMRLITLVPAMRRVASGLLAAVPGLGAVVGIIAVLHCVASVAATKLFADEFPHWFGTLAESAFTMFQIMTLEDWSSIVRSVMDVYPYAWLFFVAYILMSTFTMLNLFIAVVVNAMQREAMADA